jgi:hypothetical protein
MILGVGRSICKQNWTSWRSLGYRRIVLKPPDFGLVVCCLVSVEKRVSVSNRSVRVLMVWDCMLVAATIDARVKNRSKGRTILVLTVSILGGVGEVVW